jgi:protein phosphatase
MLRERVLHPPDIRRVGLMSDPESLWARLLRFLSAPFRRAPRNLDAQAPAPHGEATIDYETPPPLAVQAEGVALRVGVRSTRGNVRPRNEDNFYVPGQPSLDHGSAWESDDPSGESPSSQNPTPGPPGLFIVADGMGGQLAGERASQMAVEIVPRELARRLDAATESRDVIRVIREAVAAANAEILAQSHLQAELANMGTTVGLALFRGGRAYVAGVGDSRVYHLRAGKLTQLTRDHSLANALEEAGTISSAEVENHKFKNILYLYLGSRDVGSGPEEVKIVDCKPGDQFLLASDGLTGVVRDDVLSQVLSSTDDPQRAAHQLVHRALENQSKDNITCIVVKLA